MVVFSVQIIYLYMRPFCSLRREELKVLIEVLKKGPSSLPFWQSRIQSSVSKSLMIWLGSIFQSNITLYKIWWLICVYHHIGSISAIYINIQYLHFIRNARLKSIRSSEWYSPITARPNHLWCRNIRTIFSVLYQFTHL